MRTQLVNLCVQQAESKCVSKSYRYMPTNLLGQQYRRIGQNAIRTWARVAWSNNSWNVRHVSNPAQNEFVTINCRRYYFNNTALLVDVVTRRITKSRTNTVLLNSKRSWREQEVVHRFVETANVIQSKYTRTRRNKTTGTWTEYSKSYTTHFPFPVCCAHPTYLKMWRNTKFSS